MKVNACLTLSVVLAAVAASPALSADFNERFDSALPAVSGFNGKIDVGYMYLDFDGLPEHVDSAYSIGSISAPIGDRFGVQIDAGLLGLYPTVAGSFDAEGGGVGGHLFWRDPTLGLLGAYAHYVRMENPFFDVDFYRYGVEG